MNHLSISGKSDGILIDWKLLFHSIIYQTVFVGSYMRHSMHKYF